MPFQEKSVPFVLKIWWIQLTLCKQKLCKKTLKSAMKYALVLGYSTYIKHIAK
jgi:hypothetical protein